MKVKYNFNLESPSKAGKGGTLPLFFNFSYGFSELNPVSGTKKYKPMRMATGFTLLEKEWDKKKSKPKDNYRQKHLLNQRMSELIKVSEELLADFYVANKKLPHPSALRELVKIKMGMIRDTLSSPLITEVIDRIVAENAKLPVNAKNKFGDKQEKKYITIRKMFEDFRVNGHPLKLENLTGEMLISFREKINTDFKERSGKSMQQNSMAKNNNTVLTVVNRAVNDFGYTCPLSTQVKKYRLTETDAANSKVFISRQSIAKVIQADTLRNKSFDNARNYLIISCLTGLRFSDMRVLNGVQIERVDFEGRNGEKLFFYGFDIKVKKASKGGIAVHVFVPILSPVQDILDSNQGKFPNFPSNQILNKQVKAFAKHANLDERFPIGNNPCDGENSESHEPLHERLTLHIGRSSYVTALRELGLPSEHTNLLTHPENAKGVVNKVYDRITRHEGAIRVVRQLVEKGDAIFNIKQSPTVLG
jgi:hypothetical protein